MTLARYSAMPALKTRVISLWMRNIDSEFLPNMVRNGILCCGANANIAIIAADAAANMQSLVSDSADSRYASMSISSL